MSEFLSSYRKDYRWPRLKPSFERRDLRCKLAAPMTEEQAKALELKCGPRRYGDVDLDAPPKLGKIGPCPKIDRLEYSEEDACLKKLLEDNPNLMSVLKKKPVADVIGQFNKERLTSTYRADYDHTNDKDEPAPEEWHPEVCPLDDPTAPEPGAECKSKHVSRKQLLRMIYGPGYCAPGPPCTKTRTPMQQQQQPATKKPQFDDACQPQYKRKCVPKWTSEYREAIGGTGLDIMREARVQARRRCRTMKRKAERRECEAKLELMFG